MEPVFYFLLIISKKIREALWLAVSAKSLSCEIVKNSACVRLPSEAAPIAMKRAAQSIIFLKLPFQAVCRQASTHLLRFI